MNEKEISKFDHNKVGGGGSELTVGLAVGLPVKLSSLDQLDQLRNILRTLVGIFYATLLNYVVLSVQPPISTR
jgi:hypothetical protein